MHYEYYSEVLKKIVLYVSLPLYHGQTYATDILHMENEV